MESHVSHLGCVREYSCWPSRSSQQYPLFAACFCEEMVPYHAKELVYTRCKLFDLPQGGPKVASHHHAYFVKVCQSMHKHGIKSIWVAENFFANCNLSAIIFSCKSFLLYRITAAYTVNAVTSWVC